MSPAEFEKLGMLYLGRPVDGPTDAPLLYDSRDLVTHAVCVGMTGSGKTGLCLALLEEAAIDGVPAIIIDPKGDLGNLLLTFPDLRPEDFRPWIVEDDALRKGMDPDAWAAKQAQTWKDGLAAWGQDGERIRTLKEKADFAIYTPGSTAGIPVNLVNAFRAPDDIADEEALAERVLTAVASLLGLLGSNADPSKSREGAFLGAILSHAWKAGEDLDLAALIGRIQRPPFQKIGVLDLESFYPEKERYQMVVALNTLLASPGFAAWNAGEPIDIARYLRDDTGRPRHAIFSIAHLDDAQRMFFVSLLLNEIVSWMRRQSGTTSLRALVYMDEIFGYLPPVANPPSKLPMLTLLKQARAFGVGVVLATQNPVDLDYKALSNTGTWFIGRLQTERDKARVIEGLLGSSSQFDKSQLEALLSSLGSRKFLLNNVHDDAPVVFESRWVMSYLRGPLTRDQIRTLMAGRTAAKLAPSATTPPPLPQINAPSVPPGIRQFYLPSDGTLRPRLVGSARVRFSDTKSGAEETRDLLLASAIPDGLDTAAWTETLDAEPRDFTTTPSADALFAELPVAATTPKNYAQWEKDFIRWIADNERCRLLSAAALKLTAKPGESEADFRARASLAQRELRDEKVDALRKKFAPKQAALATRLARAEAAVEKQKEQARNATFSSAISIGSTLLGAFLGRKTISASTINRAGTAARGVGRAMREGADVDAAKESVETVLAEKAQFETDCTAELAALSASLSEPEITALDLKPARGGITVNFFGLGWI
jgi:hypothetical protein